MAKELSGAQWVARFPDGKTTAALADDFKPGCEAFIAAMQQTVNPQNVPAEPGVDIEWVHRRADGSIDLVASRKAAKAMVNGYGIAYPPARHSRHSEGHAVDMTIGWSGKLAVSNKDGSTTTIADAPRNGANLVLWRVGKTYGVIKNPTDPPHWSTDGR